MFRHILSLFACTSLASGLFGQQTEILSDATADYVPFGSDQVITVRSDMVRAMVEEMPRFTLMHEQRRQALRGTTVALTHRLSNHGAQPLLFRVFARSHFVSQFQPSELHIHTDVNGNGEVDPDDPEVMEGDAVPLAGNSEIGLLVRVGVPVTAGANTTASIAVMAQEVVTQMQQMRINTVEALMPDIVTGLFIEKTVSRPEIEVGETVEFTVRVRNITNQPITVVQLMDVLPVGFSYLSGSMRAGNVRAGDPARGAGYIAPDLGDLAPGAVASITYTARAGVAALAGNGMSRAQASALGFISNFAAAAVRVRQGVFTTKGVIFGRVFVDTNENGLLDEDELGVPGVRIFIEDGTSALTDADGKYSFYGLSPRTHVVKVDNTTLPAGARIRLTTNAQAGDAGSQFAGLKNSEMHKSNFALTAIPEALAEVESRRSALLRPHAEITRELSGRLTPDGQPLPMADPKALPSSGIIGAGGDVDASLMAAPSRPATAQPAAIASKSVAAANNLDVLAAVTDNEFGFATLRDGAVLPGAQTDIWIKGPVGARFSLAVNGEIIDEKQVGTKATVPDRNAEAWNFVGVNLVAGANRLRATMLDPFGNVRGSATIKVVAPGALAYIKVTPPERAVADGSTISYLNIELVDARGILVTSRTPLSLDISRGQWRMEDLDPATPGAQVFVEGGRASFPIVPPLDPGEAEVRVVSGAVKNESTLTFQPNLRPMIATGVIEGTLHLGSRGQGSIFPIGARDVFEQELRTLSASSSDGRLNSGGRAAFFLKGKIRGDYLLTAAYDSEKTERERLFRDIQPGEFYPVYGDASERSYDAQSTGRLYVRIDRERSYLLVGDFTTTAAPLGGDSAQSLGNYQRSLTGAKEHYETQRVTANIWASQDSTRQIVREVPGNGTSGPYDFTAGEMVANSERVEILTRDRNQPSRVIETRSLIRFLDYEFEPLAGRLLLRAPVPSVDADLNPISIRITAEVDQGGEKFWVYGGDAHVKLTSKLEVGGGYARDENIKAPGDLASADATYKFADRTKLVGEIARSDSLADGEGWAGRFDFKHQSDRVQLHAYLAKTEVSFRNAGALLLPGRIEGGLRFNYKLTSTTTLLTQGIVTESLANGNEVRGLRADIERAFGAWRVAVGARHSEETVGRTGVTSNTDSLRTRITAPVPRLSGANMFAEYERDVRYGRELAAVGFDKAFSSGGRAYARHEFITSLDGPFELDQTQRKHTTVFGLDRPFMKNGQSFSEYRMDNELTGREAEAASGLRNLWQLAPGVRANTSFERITPISGTGRNESTSVTGALDYATSQIWRANGRLELRSSTSTDSLLNTLGYARLLDRDWTFLGKTIFLMTKSKGAGAGETIQGRGQLGLAWRPARFDRWNALGKYELKYESDSRATATFSDRTTQMLAMDVNYQPDAQWVFSTHVAGKWVQETRALFSGDSMAHMVGERVAYTINRRWDIALNASALFGEQVDQGRFAFGPEVGVLLGRNLNLGLGFNFVGFRDADFAADGSTARGAYIRLRFKFDENLIPGRGEPSTR